MVTQLVSVWLQWADTVNFTYLAVVATLSLSTLGSCIQFAGSGIAAGVLAFLWGVQNNLASFMCTFYMINSVGTQPAQTSTVPQSHSSPGSRKAFPQTGPPWMRSVEGIFNRQAGFTSSRNLLSCCWLQLLNCCGYTMLEDKMRTRTETVSTGFALGLKIVCLGESICKWELGLPDALSHDAAFFW